MMPTGYIDGLKISFTSVTQVAITLGACRDFDDSFNMRSTGTLTAAITTSGVNGLDTGSESSDTWYAVHIIDDTSGTNSAASLLSLSATAPTLPSGYDVFRRVGWARNNGSSNFMAFFQTQTGKSRKVWYDVDENNTEVLAAGSAVVFTTVDCSDFIPSTSNETTIYFQWDNDNVAGNDFVVQSNDATFVTKITSLFNVQWGVGVASASGLDTARGHIETPISSSQQIKYILTSTAEDITLSVLAYIDEL